MPLPNPKTFVPPSGPSDAKVALVGEQPGQMEVRRRRPFIGPAGRELDSDLNSAGLIRQECYITNTIKDLDWPIQRYMKYISRRDAKYYDVSPEAEEYFKLLKKELTDVDPNVIVAIGNPALWALCSVAGIMSYRGSVLESTLIPGKKVVPIIHPATVIPPKKVYLNKHLIIMDLNKVRREKKFPEIRRKARKSIIAPTFDEAMGYLWECFDQGIHGRTIDYDIEVYNEEVSCISFAISPIRAMCIPFINSAGDYFSVEQEAEIWLMIGRIMSHRGIKKRGQNLSFDSHFLLKKYGIKVYNVDDTMVAQNTLFPDYPKGLHFITTMYTDMPYYKDDGKYWFKIGGSFEDLWVYNNKDSLSTSEAFPKQVFDLKRQKNLHSYRHQVRLIEPLTYMEERGIRVDVEGMKAEAGRLETEVRKLEEQLNSKAGMELNAKSSKQVMNYFYVIKGHKPYLHKGRPTTNDMAMKRLIRKGFKEAKLVQQIRKYYKLMSNYLDIEKVDSDGRLRCSYNPVGTRFSRLSSSANIFGTGMNMQNWPHSMLKFLLADDGYVYYSYDLSQFENRIVAYVGNVVPMIEAFEAGRDVHSLTAGLILGKPPDEISNEDGSSTIGDGTHSERFWGKKSNHGLNYDLGYKNFALNLEIPEREAKWIVEKYHSIYPGVRQNYHAMVRRQLSENRTLTNLLGRKTLFLGEWGDSLFKEAYACIPQGTCGDVINRRGVCYIYYDQDQFKDVELLIQVHDSVGFQIPLSTSWTDHARILLSIKRSLETPLKWKDREFVVPADLTMGLSFAGGKEFKHKNFPATEEALAKELEKAYERLLIQSETHRQR